MLVRQCGSKWAQHGHNIGASVITLWFARRLLEQRQMARGESGLGSGSGGWVARPGPTLRAPSRPASMMGGGSSVFFDCVPFRNGPPAASSTGRGACEPQEAHDRCATKFIIRGSSMLYTHRSHRVCIQHVRRESMPKVTRNHRLNSMMMTTCNPAGCHRQLRRRSHSCAKVGPVRRT